LTITREQILEEARIYRSLTNDISESWDKVLKWKKISQAELSRRTGLTERTITTTVTGQRIASLDNIVVLCLAANLPSDISGHLIRLSGHALIMSNEEHVIYNYLLKNMYTESLSEIRQFLYDIGS
jgi:hypothetical protein